MSLGVAAGEACCNFYAKTVCLKKRCGVSVVPIGLDLGGRSASEIALAILAEVKPTATAAVIPLSQQR